MMRIKYRYSVNTAKTELIEKLENYGLYASSDYGIAVYNVYDDNPYWKNIKSVFDEYGKEHPITEAVYTRREIADAAWLSVRSKWRWEYPQPEDEYKHITYNDAGYCDQCGRGLIQRDSFYLKKEPKWGSRQFMQPFWVEDELFLKNDIIDELLNAGIKGTAFIPVKHYKTKNDLTTIKQMQVEKLLKEGLCFDEGDIDETIVCTKCGLTKHVLFGHAQLKVREDALKHNSVDILKTKDVFGGGLIAARTILITNKFAKLILDKKWKSLVLEPVELI